MKFKTHIQQIGEAFEGIRQEYKYLSAASGDYYNEKTGYEWIFESIQEPTIQPYICLENESLRAKIRKYEKQEVDIFITGTKQFCSSYELFTPLFEKIED